MIVKKAPLFLFIFSLLFLISCKRASDHLYFKNEGINDSFVLPDSILQRAEGYHSELKKSEYLLDLCEQYLKSNPNYSLNLARLAEQLSKDANLDFEYARALYWKAFVLNQEDPQNITLQKALAEVKISIALFKKMKDFLWLSKALNLRALIHYNLYEESVGAIYNIEAQQVLKENNLTQQDYPKVWADIFRTAGNIELYTSKNTDTVLYYFNQSYQYYQVVKDTSNLARLLTNYAIVYEKRNEFTLADSAFQKAITLYDKSGNNFQKANIYLDYATFLANQFKISKEKKWFEKSNFFLSKAIALNPLNITEIHFQYGANFQNLASYSIPKNKIFFDSASSYYEKVLVIGVEEKNTKYIEKAAQEISKICLNIDFKKCQELLSKTSESYQAIVDSTTTALNIASQKMEAFQEKQTKQEKRRIIIWSTISIIGLIILFVTLFQRSRITYLNNQLSTRLESLRSQMNPHFISNSLNAIDSLINQGRNEEASEYIIDFSRLCRLILSNSKKDFISLKKELETLNYYLSLEKLRMRKKLHYKFEVEDELNLEKILIPPMLLQPFIENAIVHGIQKKQSPGHILISIKPVYGQIIEYIIEDNGIGRKKAESLKTQSVVEQSSWGINITKERIESIKKIKGAKFEIIDLVNAKGQAIGTRVIIKFPIINNFKALS